MRVWIETKHDRREQIPYLVTLRVRVWIETEVSAEDGAYNKVTLRVRVWIETPNQTQHLNSEKSPSA